MLGGQDDVKNIANKRSKSSSVLPRINNKRIDSIDDNNNKLHRSFSKRNIKDNALYADEQNKNNISNDINNDSKADEAYEECEEPIYAISDFEGRFDYYIRFFTDIGFLDKKKLYDAVEGKIKNSDKQDKEKNKELEMLKILFDSPEEWFKEIIKHFNFFGTDMLVKVKDEDNVYKTNIERLNFLKTYFTEDVLKSAINKNFKGKIVINGDLYSSRVNDLFGKKKDEIVAINKLCFNALNAIKTNNDVKDKLILVAGNHDVYHIDYADSQCHDSHDDDILKDIKNQTLQFLTKWFKVTTKDGKMLIFKHSPYLQESEGIGNDLSEIINNEKNCQEVGITKIIKYAEDNSNDRDHTYQYYFYNGFSTFRNGSPNPTFHKNNELSKTIITMLTNKSAKLVVGHCHAGGKIKDGCICIDDDGKYKYRVFHFEKKKDISNDKNNVDDECNSLNSTRESIYFDDIKDNVMLGMSANNANSNNNNNISFQYRYINQKKPNITNEEFQQISQNNKNQLPPNFDKDDIMKFRAENKQTQPANNKAESRKDKNNILNKAPNHQSQDNNEYRDNPVFTILDNVNKSSGQQDDNNKTEQKKQDIPLYTFSSTNTATFNQQQPQNKEVSCEMVRNCLSSMCECFNCKCG